MRIIFTQSLSTPKNVFHTRMFSDHESFYITKFMFVESLSRWALDDEGVLSVRINPSDASDIFESINTTNQLMTKAISLGEVLC